MRKQGKRENFVIVEKYKIHPFIYISKIRIHKLRVHQHQTTVAMSIDINKFMTQQILENNNKTNQFRANLASSAENLRRKTNQLETSVDIS